MTYAQLEFYVSQPRLNRFLRACSNSKQKAQKLYKINLRVAQAYYPLMNLFETFIRNAIYNELSGHFGDRDWIIHQKTGFMSDLSLTGSKFFLRTSTEKAERNIRRACGLVTSSKIIAEHTFGFWTAFFDLHHFKLVGGSPLKAFRNKPHWVNRSIMVNKLSRIREFRNRIYHNEPICFRGSAIDFSAAKEVVEDIHSIMESIDPGLQSYTDYFNNINSKIDQADRL